LKILSEEALKNLIFKGGTSFKKLLFGTSGRFSTDLDFTSAGMSAEDLSKLIARTFNEKEHYGLRFKVKEENIRSGFNANDESYLAEVEYEHEWNSSEFGLEVSYREKPTLALTQLLQQEEMYFKYLEFPNFPIQCLQKEEMLAEKLRAALQRLRSRDLYDLYLFSQKPLDKIRLKKIVVLKCWNVREPFSPDLLFAKISKGDYNWEDLEWLVRRKSLPPQATIVKKVLEEYSFLRDLDRNLIRLIEDSKVHKETDFVAKFKMSL
jgi:predicted nucleotidyltransferase component of viral defense system